MHAVLDLLYRQYSAVAYGLDSVNGEELHEPRPVY
jgi:hypothetical protein